MLPERTQSAPYAGVSLTGDRWIQHGHSLTPGTSRAVASVAMASLNGALDSRSWVEFHPVILAAFASTNCNFESDEHTFLLL